MAKIKTRRRWEEWLASLLIVIGVLGIAFFMPSVLREEPNEQLESQSDWWNTSYDTRKSSFLYCPEGISIPQGIIDLEKFLEENLECRLKSEEPSEVCVEILNFEKWYACMNYKEIFDEQVKCIGIGFAEEDGEKFAKCFEEIESLFRDFDVCNAKMIGIICGEEEIEERCSIGFCRFIGQEKNG